MTTQHDEPNGDEVWRRPSGVPDAQSTGPWSAGPQTPTANTPAAGPSAYTGPPPTKPPPPGWRPPTVLQPTAPRQLPPQDLARIENDERSARTLTLSVGMFAGAVALIVTCLLCSRLIF